MKRVTEIQKRLIEIGRLWTSNLKHGRCTRRIGWNNLMANDPANRRTLPLVFVYIILKYSLWSDSIKMFSNGRGCISNICIYRIRWIDLFFEPLWYMLSNLGFQHAISPPNKTAPAITQIGECSGKWDTVVFLAKVGEVNGLCFLKYDQFCREISVFNCTL